MAVPERQTDMPALRELRDAGGFLTTDELRPRLEAKFTEPLGQWNIISNMDGKNSLISRGLVSRQVRDEGGDWYDFNDHLPKEGTRPEQRLALTERGRLLLARVSNNEAMIPDSFEEIVAEQIVALQERVERAESFAPQPDDADRDLVPKETTIPQEAPQAPKAGDYPHDPEARRKANARRVASHHELVLALTGKATDAGLDVTQTRYADALIRTKSFGAIFEMKTIRRNGRSDLIRQVRGAIAQLYHYRFIHRKSSGFERNVKLYAVFNAPVPQDLVSFLREINICVVWYTDGRFQGDPATLEELPWLVDR